MPTIDDNRAAWNDPVKWTTHGDEWSATWGGVVPQWYGTLLPRVRAFVPTGTILEIAPGHGRWTQFLRRLCQRLVLVDLSETCIDACRKRFAGDLGIMFHVNDGRSLAAVANGSVDFIFSFDSLVHAEADVMLAYLEQLAHKLTPHGIGFLHHSNLGSYVDPATGAVPATIDNSFWRATSVSAALVRAACKQFDLCCISQELINWGPDTVLNDAITVVGLPSHRGAAATVILENRDFMREAQTVANLARLYDAFGSR